MNEFRYKRGCESDTWSRGVNVASLPFKESGLGSSPSGTTL